MVTKETIKRYFKGNYKRFFRKYLTDARLNGGSEGQATCPFHNDYKPSLCFNNQSGTFYCHGCGAKGDIFHFYGMKNGLDIHGEFQKILQGIVKDFGITRVEEKQKIVETYDYKDESGQLLFQVCRLKPKGFYQRRPDGKGDWICNLKGVQPVLYGLQEVVKAGEVLIVEGEKDADTARSLGMCGTTCPMGAGKWMPEFSEYLRGKDVVLIPDNDQPGREHMSQVALAVNGIARSLKWIELPDLPVKGDLTDWVEQVGDREEASLQLAEMIDRADYYNPPRNLTLEDIVLSDVDFLDIPLPMKDKILDPWLTEQSITLIAGWRGTGKTWFAMSLLDSITRGKAFGPWALKKSVPCLYLEGEMPAQDVRERIKSLNPYLESRKSPLYIYSDAYANFSGLSRANLLSEDWRLTMKRILTIRKIKLWVIDNLASLSAGIDENCKQDWDPINSWLLDLRFVGISTILLHHTNKTGLQRGTSSREDNIDISIELRNPHDYTPEDGARFVVHFSKSRVESSSLSLIGDSEFHLKVDEEGLLTWQFGNVKRLKKLEILRMLNEGLDQSSICEILGIDKGYVSRIKKNAIRDGILSTKGRLTQSGFMMVAGTEK